MIRQTTFFFDKRHFFLFLSQIQLMAYRCVIVEDNEIDRLTLRMHVKSVHELTIVGEFEQAEQALTFILEEKPDILFLDIDMGEMDGLTLRSKLPEVPVCVFITSHPEYALEGFEQNALDFISKPLSKQRFLVCVERIRQYLQLQEKAHLLDTHFGESILIKDGIEQHKVQLHEIQYMEALKDYTKIVTKQKVFSVYGTLGNLINEKSFANFIRIHRSYAVPKHLVSSIKSGEILVEGHALPVGRMYKQQIQNLLS